jgi:hypothetical protein
MNKNSRYLLLSIALVSFSTFFIFSCKSHAHANPPLLPAPLPPQSWTEEAVVHYLNMQGYHVPLNMQQILKSPLHSDLM